MYLKTKRGDGSITTDKTKTSYINRIGDIDYPIYIVAEHNAKTSKFSLECEYEIPAVAVAAILREYEEKGTI